MQKNDEYFGSVYEDTYHDLLRYVVIKTRSAADVEDILQNAYAKFYRRIQKRGHEDIENVRAFLMRVVQGEIKNYYRFRITRDAHEAPMPDDAPTDALSVEDEAVSADLLRSVWGVVKGAPVLSYKAFVLRYYFGMSVPEIADAIGLTQSGVTSRLHRVRADVRNQLEKEWKA